MADGFEPRYNVIGLPLTATVSHHFEKGYNSLIRVIEVRISQLVNTLSSRVN